MSKKHKQKLLRIIIAALTLAACILPEKLGVFGKLPFEYAAAAAFFIPYIIAGFDIFGKAFAGIKGKQIFDENLLMIIASIGAFAVKEYAEAAAVLIFYQVGELFESIAVDRSRKSVKALTDICPEYANLKTENGIETVDPDEVGIGDIIVIKPGERVPLDCRVTEGASFINTAAVTGESVPRRAEAGSTLLSGCINGEGLLCAEVTSEFENSTAARILELVENAAEKKAPTERFISRFAKYYTPTVVICAILLAFIPPIFVGSLSDWLHRACTFLVVSCPCALVISIPMSFFGGIGAASSKGILFNGGSCIEQLARLETIAFDKTGTLTDGSFGVKEVTAINTDEEALLALCLAAEQGSNHPIAKAIIAYCGENTHRIELTDIKEIAGKGVTAVHGSKLLLVGSSALLRYNGINTDEESLNQGTTVYIAEDGVLLGKLLLADTIKPEAAPTVAALKKAGIKNTIILTGDKKEPALAVSKEVGADKAFYSLLPDEKAAIIKNLVSENKNGTVAFAGDGINDAPSLVTADTGIAMGGVGSDAAIEAADVVLVEDDLSKLPLALKIARKTVKTVKTNIIFTFSVKLAVLILGSLGLASMWAAVFADVGVAVLAILNAMRILKIKPE